MSVLTEALDQLTVWLEQNHPNLAASLRPGLTLEEIDIQFQHLLLPISQEIYELYQWSNGCNLFRTYYYSDEALNFLPLETAIRYNDEAGYLSEQRNIPGFFMFSEFERWLHFAVCDGNQTSPVLVITDDPYTRLAYTSITSMVLTNLECYERGVFQIQSHRTFSSVRLNDEKEFRNIFKNHNNLISFFEQNEVLSKIISIFEGELLQLYSEGERNFNKYNICRSKYYLRNAQLSRANFSGLDLSHSEFHGADLTEVDFSNAELRGVRFRDANLQGANLSGACLTGAHLNGANLQGANVEGVNLKECYKYKTIMPDGSIVSD